MTVRVLLIECLMSMLILVVISNPMDLQTMLRKVKQRQYKSKKEFKDDLDLIWSNCFTYNATEVSGVSKDDTSVNHPATPHGAAPRHHRRTSQRPIRRHGVDPDGTRSSLEGTVAVTTVRHKLSALPGSPEIIVDP